MNRLLFLFLDQESILDLQEKKNRFTSVKNITVIKHIDDSNDSTKRDQFLKQFSACLYTYACCFLTL